MTKLACTVTNCLHNCDSRCCKQTIIVGRMPASAVKPAAEASMKTETEHSRMYSKLRKTVWRLTVRQ